MTSFSAISASASRFSCLDHASHCRARPARRHSRSATATSTMPADPSLTGIAPVRVCEPVERSGATKHDTARRERPRDRFDHRRRGRGERVRPRRPQRGDARVEPSPRRLVDEARERESRDGRVLPRDHGLRRRHAEHRQARRRAASRRPPARPAHARRGQRLRRRAEQAGARELQFADAALDELALRRARRRRSRALAAVCDSRFSSTSAVLALPFAAARRDPR